MSVVGRWRGENDMDGKTGERIRRNMALNGAAASRTMESSRQAAQPQSLGQLMPQVLAVYELRIDPRQPGVAMSLDLESGRLAVL